MALQPTNRENGDTRHTAENSAQSSKLRLRGGILTKRPTAASKVPRFLSHTPAHAPKLYPLQMPPTSTAERISLYQVRRTIKAVMIKAAKVD